MLIAPVTANKPTPAIWTKELVERVADPRCDCWGQGFVKREDGETVPCACVLRAVFRAVWERFDELDARTTFRMNRPTRIGATYAHTEIEFCADFHLCVKRTLNAQQHKLFTNYVLLARPDGPADQLAQIAALLGRAFTENALWPLDRYFPTKPKPKRKRIRRRTNKVNSPAA